VNTEKKIKEVVKIVVVVEQNYVCIINIYKIVLNVMEIECVSIASKNQDAWSVVEVKFVFIAK
jgi:hypothetical protein